MILNFWYQKCEYYSKLYIHLIRKYQQVSNIWKNRHFYIIRLRNKDSFQFLWKFNYVTFRNTFWRESILHTKMDWLSRLTTFFDMKAYSILRVRTFKWYQILLPKRIRVDEEENLFIDIDSSSNDFISIMKWWESKLLYACKIINFCL